MTNRGGRGERVALVASSPIIAHALNATAVVRSLRRAGVRVVWYGPAELEDHARRLVSGDFVAMDPHWVEMADAGIGTGVESGERTGGAKAPRERVGATLGSLAGVRRLDRDALAGPVAAHAQRLEQLLSTTGAGLLVSDTLMLAAGVVAEQHGVAWASLGDGPLAWPHPQVPPFGTGLPVLGGAPGRHRNRTVKRAVDAMLFADALAELNRVRARCGLWPVADLVTAGVSRQLHLQGCTRSFEHPRDRWPGHVVFVGALGPGTGTAPPVPPALRRGTRPGSLAFVTQGTRRRDPRELVDPAVDVLLDEGYQVLVTGAAPSRARQGVTWLPRVDYPQAMAEADVFVTNGGYTGVTLALASATPVVQCGATEEKADIGARLRGCGAGESLPLVRPPRWLLRRAVRRATTLPERRAAQQRLAADFAALDTDQVLRDQLIRLASWPDGGGGRG